MIRTEFRDSQYWDGLSKEYLSRYPMPSWNRPLSEDGMARWAERLGVNYEEITNTTNKEFMELNKDWPLRAFIGLLLEAKHESGSV